MQRTPDPSLACPGCGAFARTFQKGASVCAYCGAALAPLPFTHPGGTFKHTTPLRIGMKAQIGGKAYVAVGRTLFRDTENYTWEEWVLLSQDGEARYLEFDEGKWNLTEYWPGGDDSVSVTRYQEGEVARVGERVCSVTSAGVMFVEGIEGEIPWPIQVGQRTPYADFASGSTIYSVELTSDGVEWFRGRHLDPAEVFTLFGLREQVSQELRKEEVLTDRRRFGCLWNVLALTAFFLCGIAYSHEGRLLYTTQLSPTQIADEGTVVGPVALKQVGTPHRLHLSSGSMSQTSMWVQGVLEDAQGPVFEAEQEFWDETGYDDGPWHEWVLEARSDFRLTQAGSYRVRVYADPELGAATTPVTIKLYEGVVHVTPLAWFGGVGLVLGTSFWLAGAPGTRANLREALRES